MKRYLLFMIACVCAVTGAWADEVTYPYSFGTGSSVAYDTSSGIMTVTVATTGDFATFVNLVGYSGDAYVNQNNVGKLRIVCSNSAKIQSSDLTGLSSKVSWAGLFDLTGASFDTDTDLQTFVNIGATYISLPTGKTLSDITLPTTGSLTGIVTSTSSGTATYTAYTKSNGGSAAQTEVSNYLLSNTTLSSISDWTVTNGAATTVGSYTVLAGQEQDAVASAIIASSTATTLSVTLDNITLGNSYTFSPSSSIESLSISGLQYANAYETLTISGGSAMTSLTISDAVIPDGLTITGCPELTTADLTDVRKKGEGTLAVTFTDDPKLSNVTLYKSSSNVSYNVSGTTPTSGVTVTWTTPAIPIEYDGCTVTLNLAARGTKTMSELITEAETALGSTDICTLIVTGEMSTTDLQSLDDAQAATRIDLSEATLASGASVDDIQVPTSLVSLVLPPGNTVSSALESKLGSCTNLEYVYSNSSDSGATTPTYVWIARTGVMAYVFENESSLVSSVYVKVAAKSGITLDQTSVDLSSTGMTNLAYLDVSESGLTTTAAQYYKAPHSNAYRIILPNNWSGDDMARFAANPNVGAIAAVYSYHDTTLKIMEIVDNSYSPAALADPRIMKSTTTEVDIVSGYYNGQTYAQFGTNLLEALNNMGKSSFSVTKDNVTTNYNNTAGLNVTTINIETTSAAPNTLTFTNPVITTLNIENLSQTNAQLNVDACTALTTLDLTGSSLQSVDASTTSLTTADLSGASISGATDFSGATALATFTTTDETSFGGALNLTSSALTSFTSAARFSGDITLNASNNLASINVSSATFTNTTSKIHIDASSTENSENTAIIDALKVSGPKTIILPTGFGASSRVHPYTEAADYIEEVAAVAAAVTYDASDMVFHDNNTSDGYYETYRYWYQGTSTSEQIATLGTSTTRTLHDIIAGNSNITPTVSAHADLTNNTHVKIKVVGPLTANSLDSLKYLNCTTLDLSDAVIETGLLKTALASDILNTNTKFLVLPDTCSREHIVNGTTLANLANVYSVIAVETTNEGRNLTSWSRVAGALQPAVVSALSAAANSWTISDGNNSRNVYTSSVSNFKVVKISGLINSYDLGGPVQGGLKLNEGGHLSWKEPVTETTSQTRTLNGSYTVYGPFAASFLLNVIDLKNAYFEPLPNQTGLGEESVYYRYYYSDMTLSTLTLISTATYKVVIPQNSKVREIPADFMNCSTNIRAICIPSNIQAIRARAFWTIDYVWTTPDAYATSSSTADPEGNNTRLDNGAFLSDGTAVSALVYNTTTHKYEENENFLDSYYTADYSGVDGGGTYTFGSTLKLIETGAFANTQPNVKDVYVLNTTAPECHVDAFNTVMYTGNGGYNSAAVSSEGIITRDAYFNGRWITMLHYPRQTTTPNVQRYTDPTRSYSIATGERDGKGAILYFPNQSEFIRAYQQGTYGYIWNAWNPTRTYGSVNNEPLTNTTAGWSADGQSAANALFNAYSTGTNHQYTSFYKVNFDGVTSTTTTLVPYYQVNWNESSYSTVDSGNLYPQSEIDANNDADGSGEMTEKDYRGWHQFVLMAYAANTVLEEEPYRSYITDNDWWTYCPTIDLTKKQVMELFGSESTTNLPYVSRLLYVRREYADNSIWLNFSDNLMVYKEDRAHSRPYKENDITKRADQHGVLDATTGIVTVSETLNSVKDSDVVMSAGVPYLIKPYREKVNSAWITQFRVFKTQEEAAKLTNTEGVKIIVDADLYQKMQNARTLTGNAQIALVDSGLYTVPVFVKGDAQSGTTKENVDATTYTIGNEEGYNKSTDWTYTFIGSHYLSPLPQYCYYLGYTASTGVTFIYNNFSPYSSDVFRWVNETGVICPTKSTSPTFTLTAASDMNAALWQINTADQTHKDGNTVLSDDSFTTANSGNSRTNAYNMQFAAAAVKADSETSGISEAVKTASSAGGKVYSLDGQLKGNSLKALQKGVYVVNGKKLVVK